MKYNIGDCFICKSGVIIITGKYKRAYIARRYNVNFKGYWKCKYNTWQIDKFFKPCDSTVIHKADKLFLMHYNIVKAIKNHSTAVNTNYKIDLYSENWYALQEKLKEHSYVVTYMGYNMFVESTYFYDSLSGSYLTKKEYMTLKRKISKLEKNLKNLWTTNFNSI